MLHLTYLNLSLSRTDGDEVADGGQVQRQDAAGAPAQQAQLVAAILALLPVVLHVQRIGFIFQGFSAGPSQVKHAGRAGMHSCAALMCSACAAHQVKHAGTERPETCCVSTGTTRLAAAWHDTARM